MPRIIDGLTQYFDGNGKPLAGGKLYFFETGSTTTAKDTFTDISETGGNENTNPLILDAEGRVATDVFGSGAYNVRLFDSDDNLVEEADPMGAVGSGQLADWNALTTYSTTSLVTGSDGNTYRSLTNSNISNDPTTDPVNWEQVEFVSFWNTNKEYSEFDRVRDSNGYLYTSLQDTNSGNTPLTATDYWRRDDAASWDIKTEAYTAVNGDYIDADTDTVGAFTITATVGPNDDHFFVVHDYKGTFETNNLTITSGADDIGNNTGDFICNINNMTATFVYDSVQGWKVL